MFLLIGLQVRWIVAGVGQLRPRRPADRRRLPGRARRRRRAAADLGVPGAVPARSDPARPRRPRAVWRHAIISWAGMRGVVTLAAAFVLPGGHPAAGGPGPHRAGGHGRHAVAQGLSLPWLARGSACTAPTRARTPCRRPPSCRRRSAPGCARLDERADETTPQTDRTAAPARRAARSTSAWERLGSTDATQETPSEAYRRLRLEMLARRADRGAADPRRRARPTTRCSSR